VPLIEDRDSPIAVGKSRQTEVAIAVALGEGKIVVVGIAHADVALGERKGITRTAAVQSLVRRAADAHVGDQTAQRVVALSRRREGGAEWSEPGTDDGWVREADGHVISSRPKLLEVRRAADLHERVVGL